MQCVSCNAIIPPEFVHSIQANICPGCGCSIMNESDKDLLDELSGAMESMPNDPQGVAGWLLSNYRFQKIGDATPVEHFHRQGSQGNQSAGPGYDTTNLKIAENPVDQFLGRTDYSNRVKDTQAKVGSMKNNKLAKLAQSIQDEPDPYGLVERQAEEQVEDVSNEDISAMRAMMQNGENPFAAGGGMQENPGRGLSAAEAAAIQSYGQVDESPEEDLLPQEMALASTGPKGREVVLKNRYKRIKAQDAVIGGSGGGGSFWRS